MITCYIAGPYTGGDVARNVRMAIDAADELAYYGIIPFIPHLSHFWHLLHPHTYEFWLKQDLAWLHRCDCVLRLPGESRGADMEVEEARRLGIPVFHQLAWLVQWCRVQEQSCTAQR